MHWNAGLLQHTFCLPPDRQNSQTISQSVDCLRRLHNRCGNLSDDKIYLLRPITSMVCSKMPVLSYRPENFSAPTPIA